MGRGTEGLDPRSSDPLRQWTAADSCACRVVFVCCVEKGPRVRRARVMYCAVNVDIGFVQHGAAFTLNRLPSPAFLRRHHQMPETKRGQHFLWISLRRKSLLQVIRNRVDVMCRMLVRMKFFVSFGERLPRPRPRDSVVHQRLLGATVGVLGRVELPRAGLEVRQESRESTPGLRLAFPAAAASSPSTASTPASMPSFS